MHCNEPKSQAESYCNREAQAPDRRGNVTEQKSERDVGCGIQRSDKGCAPCWHEESREVQVIPGAIQDACVDQQFPSVCVCVCAFLCHPLADAVVHKWTVVVKPCMLAVSSFTIKTFQTKQPNIREQNGGDNQDKAHYL